MEAALVELDRKADLFQQEHRNDLERFIRAVDAPLKRVVDILVEDRAKDFEVPRRVCILPPFPEGGPTEIEREPSSWQDRRKRMLESGSNEAKEGKGTFKKEKRLFLICATTERLALCGHGGQGYKIDQSRT